MVETVTVKKQPELKGMPKKTEMEKAGEAVLEKWENLQKRKAELTAAKEAWMALAKKSGRSELCLKDSNDILRRIAYKESEGVTVTKAGDDD